MNRFRGLLKMRKAKTVPLSSKMRGPDDDQENSKAWSKQSMVRAWEPLFTCSKYSSKNNVKVA